MILLVLKCRLFHAPYLSPLEALPTVPYQQEDLCFKLRFSALCALQPPQVTLLALNPICDPSFWISGMPFPCLKTSLPIFLTSSNPHPTPAFLSFGLITIRYHMKGFQFSFLFNIFMFVFWMWAYFLCLWVPCVAMHMCSCLHKPGADARDHPWSPFLFLWCRVSASRPELAARVSLTCQLVQRTHFLHFWCWRHCGLPHPSGTYVSLEHLDSNSSN